MFRREMGSKRGSLPPKEGDLTCMSYSFQSCLQSLNLKVMYVVDRSSRFNMYIQRVYIIG